MQYNIKTGDIATIKTGCLIIGIFSTRTQTEASSQVDLASKNGLSKVLKKGDFKANIGESTVLYDLPGVNANRVVLLGLGKKKEFNANLLAKTFKNALSTIKNRSLNSLVLALPDSKDCDIDVYEMVRDSIIAGEDELYIFDQCKSEEAKKTSLKKVFFHIQDKKLKPRCAKGMAHGQAIANGMSLSKDLSNLPGNICTPTYLASAASKVGHKHKNLKVSALSEKQMKKLGMGSLLSVSLGSREEAKLIIMEYNGGSKNQKPTVFVGKGLTFDAGGISIKPGAGMDEMKYDMCGGASVIGTMQACAELQLPINVVGIVPSSENMPDGAANKPGDIVTSMSGQTIEILNTDAEGRLILCDALTYAERFNPDSIIDIATLTGAVIVALGHHATGLMSKSDKLCETIVEASNEINDKVWRLPIWDEYQPLLNSNFADMANIGGRSAGSITAACFLSRYTEKMNWAHLDIAGTAWVSGAAKGATGRPVPLLTQILLKRSKQV